MLEPQQRRIRIVIKPLENGDFSLVELQTLTMAMERMAQAHKEIDKVRHDDEMDFGPEEW